MTKRIFSGIQPSGDLHIGNYLGAIKNWVKLQDKYESIFCVVDMHAITAPQNPVELKKRTIEVAKAYLAAGIDPKKSTIFVQSQVGEHAELMWILNTITRVAELEKMTQFKDKSKTKFFAEVYQKNKAEIEALMINKFVVENKKELNSKDVLQLLEHIFTNEGILQKERVLSEISSGIFEYPVLMAADILLYDTNIVPVGHDQIQHIELTRTLASRFNNKFGETFTVPEPHVSKESMRIMGLDDPLKKMGKSEFSEYNRISLLDDAETVRKKIKKAVTDSGSEIVYSDEKPALKNLINIYAAFSEKTPEEVEGMYAGKGYADFKKDLAETIINFLEPFQKRYNALTDEEVLEILEAGSKKVRPMAKKKLDEVKQKIGFIV